MFSRSVSTKGSIDREQIVNHLLQDFSKRVENEIDSKTERPSEGKLRTLSETIFDEFQRHFADNRAELTKKWTSFKQNLRDTKNKSFYRKILSGLILPAELPNMSSEDMMDDEVKNEKRRREEAELKLLKDANEEQNAAILRHKSAINEKLGFSKLDGIDLEQTPPKKSTTNEFSKESKVLDSEKSTIRTWSNSPPRRSSLDAPRQTIIDSSSKSTTTPISRPENIIRSQLSLQPNSKYKDDTQKLLKTSSVEVSAKTTELMTVEAVEKNKSSISIASNKPSATSISRPETLSKSISVIETNDNQLKNAVPVIKHTAAAKSSCVETTATTKATESEIEKSNLFLKSTNITPSKVPAIISSNRPETLSNISENNNQQKESASLLTKNPPLKPNSVEVNSKTTELITTENRSSMSLPPNKPSATSINRPDTLSKSSSLTESSIAQSKDVATVIKHPVTKPSPVETASKTLDLTKMVEKSAMASKSTSIAFNSTISSSVNRSDLLSKSISLTETMNNQSKDAVPFIKHPTSAKPHPIETTKSVESTGEVDKSKSSTVPVGLSNPVKRNSTENSENAKVLNAGVSNKPINNPTKEAKPSTGKPSTTEPTKLAEMKGVVVAKRPCEATVEHVPEANKPEEPRTTVSEAESSTCPKRHLSLSEYQSTHLKTPTISKVTPSDSSSPGQQCQGTSHPSPIEDLDSIPLLVPRFMELKVMVKIELEKSFSASTCWRNLAEYVNNQPVFQYTSLIVNQLILLQRLHIKSFDLYNDLDEYTEHIWKKISTVPSFVAFEVRSGDGNNSYQWYNSQNKSPLTEDHKIFPTLSEHVGKTRLPPSVKSTYWSFKRCIVPKELSSLVEHIFLIFITQNKE